MKRKHSKRLFVQFNDLKQVKAAQEGGPKDEAVLTTPQAVPVYPNLAIAMSPA